jgi:hypothetical protein
MNARWRTVLRVRAVLRLLLDAHVPLGALSRVVEQVRRISDEDLPNEQRVFGASMTGALARDILNELLGDDVELIDRDVPIASAFKTAADTWHGQREKWRDLIEHIRERQQHARDLKALGSACSEVLVREHDELLAWIGKVQPDPRPPGEPRDLLRIGDELRRRRQARARAAEVAGGDRDRDAQDEHAAVLLELDELLAFVLPLMGAPLPAVERVEAWLESSAFYDLMQAYRHAPLVPLGEAAARFEEIKAEIRKATRA